MKDIKYGILLIVLGISDILRSIDSKYYSRQFIGILLILFGIYAIFRKKEDEKWYEKTWHLYTSIFFLIGSNTTYLKEKPKEVEVLSSHIFDLDEYSLGEHYGETGKYSLTEGNKSAIIIFYDEAYGDNQLDIREVVYVKSQDT